MKNLKPAAGYLRVSTDDQADNGISLDYQEQQCREASKRDGHTDILIIRDEGKSGKNLNRSGIKEVIDLAKKKEISVVYVTHSDRLARNIVDHSFLRHTFLTNGVDLKYLNGQSSGYDASSIMADNMFATINQYHSDNTREKTRQATTAKALAGYFPTHAPVGYLNCSNPDKTCEKVAKKIIVPHPKTATWVSEAFKLYSTGQYNAYELNDLLYEKGLVSGSGKKLSPSMFYDMLRNRLYLGEIHWLDIHVKDGKHPPLVDENTFNRVQSVISQNAGSRCRRRKYFWLLNGYITCPIHKRRFAAEWHLKKSIAYYHCSNKSGCGKYIEKSDLESQVAQKFKNLQFSDEFIKSIVEKVRLIYQERKNEYCSKQRGLQNEQNAWQARLKVAEDRLLDETIAREDYMRLKAEANENLTKLSLQLQKIAKTKDINIDVLSEILAFTRNIYNVYMQSPEVLQKKFIAFFYEGFEVSNGVIVKDRYSPLFEELIRSSAISCNTPKPSKPNKNRADSAVILNSSLGA